MKYNSLELAIAGIAVLFVITIAVYGVSIALVPGTGDKAAVAQNESQGNATHAGDSPATEPSNQKTAFGALSSASADPALRSWLADKTIAYIASIASDFCTDGESDQWTITYASDKGQYIVFVTGGSIAEARDAQSSLHQEIDPRTLIDSDRAWQVTAGDIMASGGTLPESASMKLVITGGKPCWDISYEASDGFRIMRVDAADGSICERTTIGQ